MLDPWIAAPPVAIDSVKPPPPVNDPALQPPVVDVMQPPAAINLEQPPAVIDPTPPPAQSDVSADSAPVASVEVESDPPTLARGHVLEAAPVVDAAPAFDAFAGNAIGDDTAALFQAWEASLEPDGTPIAEPSPSARAAQHEADMASVRELFKQLAAGYARPLRDFLLEVRFGDPAREWIDVATPGAVALRRAAGELELPELASALDGFVAALELAVDPSGSTLSADARELLEGAYAKLVELMPKVFALEAERGRREPVIVQSLLLQVPDVRKVALDKIYAAGLSTLDMFYASRPRDIAEATGLAIEVATRVCDRFQAYKRDIAALRPTTKARGSASAWPSSPPSSPISTRRTTGRVRVGRRRPARRAASARNARGRCSRSTCSSRASARSIRQGNRAGALPPEDPGARPVPRRGEAEAARS